jgi:hypothetical protein
VLDALGIEPLVREVFVANGASTRIDLWIPSAATLKATACGPRAASDSIGLVIGNVRTARDRAPSPGATVLAEWLEMTFSRAGVTRSVRRATTTAASNGWFALCGVPLGGRISLGARRGSDSTARVEMDVPANGVLRRELYLGTGRAPLRGVVVSDAGKPVAGAQVGILDGPSTRTNAAGEFALSDVPTGTQTISARSIGFVPDRHPVDVLADDEPLRVVLAPAKITLDTVKVAATSLRAIYMAEFEQRRQTGTGRYITQDDVARRKPVVTSDLFRNVPGVYLLQTRSFDGFTEKRLAMRGTYEDRCSPAIYIDRRYMSDISADDIDDWVQPEEVAGIEVYAMTEVPPQFDRGMAGGVVRGSSDSVQRCGSIVIWTKPSRGGR